MDLAHALLACDEPDAAAREFQEIVRLAPEDAWVRGPLYVGGLCAGQGQVDEAIAEFRRALTSRPQHVTAHLMLGRLLNSRGRRAEAREQWEAVLEANARGLAPEMYQVTEARRLLAENPRIGNPPGP